MAWPTSIVMMEIKVENQVAAPAKTRTPNLHRAKQKSLHQECGWKGGDSGDSARRKTLSNQKRKEIP
jgi:hypothetical protein